MLLHLGAWSVAVRGGARGATEASVASDAVGHCGCGWFMVVTKRRATLAAWHPEFPQPWPCDTQLPRPPRIPHLTCNPRAALLGVFVSPSFFFRASQTATMSGRKCSIACPRLVSSIKLTCHGLQYASSTSSSPSCLSSPRFSCPRARSPSTTASYGPA